MSRSDRMPSLPRIRRTRPGSAPVVARAERAPLELAGAGLTWIHLDRPHPAATDALSARFGWHALDVEDVLSKRQRPKVDEYPEYLFTVLHFPVYDKAIQRLNAAELDVFLGPDYLVTLPNVELLPVTRLFRRCEEDEELRAALFAKGSGRLLYEVLDDLFDYCFPILDKIGHKLDTVEDAMFEERAEDVVRDISNVKQEIISYRKIIKPERSTLRLLERRVERFLPEELDLYFDDIVDASERIWDLLDNYKEVVEALEDTNESVISHRQNDVLRVLTVFSAVVLPADPDHRHLRDERGLPGQRQRGRLLGRGGDDGRRHARPARLLPLQALALKPYAEVGGTRMIGTSWARIESISACSSRSSAVSVSTSRPETSFGKVACRSWARTSRRSVSGARCWSRTSWSMSSSKSGSAGAAIAFGVYQGARNSSQPAACSAPRRRI